MSPGSRVAIAGRAPALPDQLAQDRDRLVGGLPAGVHDLRVTGPQPAVRVDAGEAEVRDPAHRPGSEAIDGGRDVETARCHGLQQRLDLGAVHGRKASAGSVPIVPADLQLDRDVLEWLALGGAIAAGLALLLVLFALARVRALNKRVRRIAGAPREAVAGIDPAALRHVAVVRYDAFGDMGGRSSRSRRRCTTTTATAW